jgi:hypothetical protein
MKLFILALFFVSTSPLIAANRKIETALGFGGAYVDDKQVESRIFSVLGNIKIEQEMTSALKAEFDIGASLETGSNNSLAVDEWSPESEWILNSGFLKYAPFDFLSLRAGAINQDEYKSPLLLSGSAFLAAKQEVTIYLLENYKLIFKIEQAIPNNQNLTKRIGSVQEGTPSFFAETIALELPGNLVSFLAEISQFSFNQLSNEVAFRSGLFGNSVTGSGTLNTTFLYRFQGINTTLFAQTNLNDSFGLNFKGQYLYNDKAPDNRNVGRLIHIGLRVESISFYGESIRNESDSSPGFYNSKTYGHNNREGFAIGISGQLKKEKLTFDMRYLQLDTINKAEIFQSNNKTILFAMKKGLEL